MGCGGTRARKGAGSVNASGIVWEWCSTDCEDRLAGDVAEDPKGFPHAVVEHMKRIRRLRPPPRARARAKSTLSNRGGDLRRRRGLDKNRPAPVPMAEIPVGRMGPLAARAKLDRGAGPKGGMWHMIDRLEVGPPTKARAACDHRLELDVDTFEQPKHVHRSNRCRRVGCQAGWPEEIVFKAPSSRRSRALLSNHGGDRRGADGLDKNDPARARARAEAPRPAKTKTLEEIAESIEHLGKIVLQRRRILCGKPRCAKFHGPYWYAFWKAGGRTRCRYIGKHLPKNIEDNPRFTIDRVVLDADRREVAAEEREAAE